MTGEVTLRGRVLPIGGLTEKTMAAYRAGMKRVIIPKDNAPDLEDIDKTVRASLTFIAAERVDEVISAALDFSRRDPIVVETKAEDPAVCEIPAPAKSETRIGAIN